MITFKHLKIDNNIKIVYKDNEKIAILVDNFTALKNQIVFADHQPQEKRYLIIDKKTEKVFTIYTDNLQYAKEYTIDFYK